uniref:(northern house mosquito) hypothetical protein n=1 Tax=Culex pipiens TaxID=7175 RepID=A0A8D8PAV9_CULPI
MLSATAKPPTAAQNSEALPRSVQNLPRGKILLLHHQNDHHDRNPARPKHRRTLSKPHHLHRSAQTRPPNHRRNDQKHPPNAQHHAKARYHPAVLLVATVRHSGERSATVLQP